MNGKNNSPYACILWHFQTAKVLPFQRECVEEEKKHTKKELQQILSLRFKRYLADLEKKGVEIIENSVKIYTGPEKAEAKGTLTVIMPIGMQAPSQLLEIPLKEEQEETGE